MKKNFLIACAGSFILAGFVFGLVVSGRMSWTAASAAATAEPPQARQTVIPATAGLPDLSPVAERALKVAATISSMTVVQNNDPFSRFLYGDEGIQSPSLGSGVVVSTDGYVLTNNHVIGNGSQIRVTLSDGRERAGRIIGVDEVTDLAVVKVDAQGLQTLPWGDSDKLRVAEWVLAIGNPFEFSGTVTLGIISTVSRSGAQVGAYGNVIQTDAAINPGNSGGALVNARGELIGINTLIYSKTGGNQGLGFAIPSNLARQIMDELITHGEIRWGSIGAIRWVTMSPSIADRFRLSNVAGALLYQMPRNSPAFQAGLRGGDIVVAMNDEKIVDADQLERKIIASPVGGRPAKLDVDRGGRRVTVTVPIVKR